MADKIAEQVEKILPMGIGFADLLHEVQKVTAYEGKDLLQLAAKTGEEVGELLQAVLSFTGAPGCKYKNKTREHIDEECIDVIICAAATLFRDQPRKNMYLAELIDKKMRKWLEKVLVEKTLEAK